MFCCLSTQVVNTHQSSLKENGGAEGGLDQEGDKEELLEFTSITDSYITYQAPFIRLLALTYIYLTYAMIVVYWYCFLKVHNQWDFGQRPSWFSSRAST